MKANAGVCFLECDLYTGECGVIFLRPGSLILIDGLVVHKSENNTSENSRHIYTFHVIDRAVGRWSSENWSVVLPLCRSSFCRWWNLIYKRFLLIHHLGSGV